MTTYSTDSEGKFIPPSQRPDGTWRKARRVRDGYVPQEEVPLYKSKGKEFASRKSDLPPGFCPIVAEAARRDREKHERAKSKREAALTAAIETPAKAAATAAALGKKQNSTKGKHKTTNAAAQCPSSPQQQQQSASSEVVEALTNGVAANLKLNDDEPIDRAKQLKKLRKKIREIESIEERLQSGELTKPEKDQLDKVKRKEAILAEIYELEQLQQDGSAATSFNEH